MGAGTPGWSCDRGLARWAGALERDCLFFLCLWCIVLSPVFSHMVCVRPGGNDMWIKERRSFTGIHPDNLCQSVTNAAKSAVSMILFIYSPTALHSDTRNSILSRLIMTGDCVCMNLSVWKSVSLQGLFLRLRRKQTPIGMSHGAKKGNSLYRTIATLLYVTTTLFLTLNRFIFTWGKKKSGNRLTCILLLWLQ